MKKSAATAGDANGERTVKSAERVFDLLETIGRNAGGVSFGRLLDELKYPKSSLHALLGVMTARGYIDHSADTRLYRLGVTAWETSHAYLRQHEIIGEARRVMDGISAETSETVQLARLEGIDNVYLAKSDGSHPLRLQSEVGNRLRAHATGLGKVLLAHLSEAELRRRFAGVELARMTPTTITELPELVDELKALRARGFGIDNEEYTPGLFCVAVPVHGVGGEVELALSISIPVSRANFASLSKALSLLVQGSREISQRSGCRAFDARLAGLSDRENVDKALTALAKSRRYVFSFALEAPAQRP